MSKLVGIIFLITVLVVVAGIIIFLSIQHPERRLDVGANIEDIEINGNLAEITLSGGANDKEIERVKFIFTDNKGVKHYYSTTEGIENLSKPYKKSIVNLFKKPDFQGIYKYTIDSNEIGFENFDLIYKVEVVFDYEKDVLEVDKEISLDSEVINEESAPSGGGGGGSSFTPDSDLIPTTKAYWKYNDNEVILLTDMPYGTSLTLVLENSGLNPGIPVEFVIYERDWFEDDYMAKVNTLVGSNGYASVTWIIEEAHVDAARNFLEGRLELYFEIRGIKSDILKIGFVEEEEITYDCDVGSIARTSGGTVYARGDKPPDETDDNAFDDNVFTKWLDYGGFDGQSWITYQYGGGTGYKIARYSITSANDVSARDPKDWNLEGSNDNLIWTILDTQSGIEFTSRWQTKNFTIANENVENYSYYRLSITDIWDPPNANSVQLSEIELYECTQVSGAEPNCSDNIQNQDETGIDCGGECEDCVASTGLVAHYAFENNLVDTTGSNSPGSLFGGSYSSGVLGQGLQLGGGGEYALVSAQNLSTNSGSVALWVMPSVSLSGYGNAFTHRIEGEDNRIYLKTLNGEFSPGFGNTLDISTGQSVPVDAWSHMAITWTGANYNAYLNGTLVASGTTSTLTSTAPDITIGCYLEGISDCFIGIIDEVKIWNYTLSAQEIASEFSSIIPQDPPTVYIADYYLAPGGSDSNNGSIDYPFFTLNKVWTVIQPGDLVYLRDGTYSFDEQQDLNGVSGTSGDLIKIYNYPGETPIFTKSGDLGLNWPAAFIYFRGDYFHWEGIEITGHYQENAEALVWYAFAAFDSSHNIFENFDVHHSGCGFLIRADSDDNLVLNGDFHHNQDPLTTPHAYDNADGIQIAYIPAGNTNTVRGCRVWWNSDDGLDLWDNEGTVIIEDSWAWYNGYIPDTFTVVNEYGNGFKYGQQLNDDTSILRITTNCISVFNTQVAFNRNNAVCNMEFYNNFAYKNGFPEGVSGGFEFWGSDVPFYIKNNIAYDNMPQQADIPNTANTDHNSWDSGLSITDDDFVSLDVNQLFRPRKADGSLPDITFGHLESDSDLIDTGIDVGLPYIGSAPDIGAFESLYTAPIVYIADYYLAPWGSDSNNGSFDYPFFTLNKLWTVVGPGDLVYLRDGTYYFNEQQDLKGVSGTSGDLIEIYNYPGETPDFTKSGSYTKSSSWPYALIDFIGDYTHWKGIEISYFTQVETDPEGWNTFYVRDSDHNIFEQLNQHHSGSGMYIRGSSTDNLVLNSDFHHNEDPYTGNQYDYRGGTPYDNADGIGLGFMDSGTTNTVRGSRLWWNSDDGLDLWHNEGNVIIEDNWVWYNGYIPDTFDEAGNGNGFKLGETVGYYPSTILRTLQRNIAFQNRAWGFLDNGGNTDMNIYNNLAYQNGHVDRNWKGGFYFANNGIAHHIRNNIAHDNIGSIAALGVLTNVDHNSWDGGVNLDNDDFSSLDFTQLWNPRKADGSLPDITFGHLIYGSDLIDAGIHIPGITDGFSGSAPDIGAFEYSVSS